MNLIHHQVSELLSTWRGLDSLKQLCHQDDRKHLPIDPPHLQEFFSKVESGERHLQDALTNLLIRRTRSHILRWYGFDAETHERVDPKRWQEYRDGKRRPYILVGVIYLFLAPIFGS